MNSKVKKTIKIVLIVILCIVLILGCATGVFFATYTAKLEFDFSEKTGNVTSGASGYLYGLAQDGVPSDEMVESVDVSSVAQKVIDGLQHPIGDIDDVYTSLDSTDYNIVYLQDIYDTWYYLNDDIVEERKAGTYDWQALLDDDYLPKVEKLVKKLMKTSYSDKTVYCLYNECDNGIWFGQTETGDDGNIWCNYNDTGKDNFNSAWKQTYDLVRSINPDAIIGGPGFCDYNSDEIEYFMSFCAENDCLPDIMIYHELDDDSIYYWQNHVEDYRQIEQELGIDELPIIVSEYGRMIDNGYPGRMVQYITQIELSKVYADNAYWRLADNLNDVCADDNSPNANWWLMRWYADMQGQTVKTKYTDIFSSDVKRSIRDKKELDSKGFMGIASISDDEDEIDIICGGGDEAKVVLKNLKDTAFNGKTVQITIEETVYKGLYGIVNEPVTMKKYTDKVGNGNLTINLSDLDTANAYHIVITQADESAISEYENNELPQRYEFEDGTLLGNAYTYACWEGPTSGSDEGMCGGFENDGDGVEITIDIPEDGNYNLDFIYGNSNDGEADENGKQSPDDRVDTQVYMSIQHGNETTEDTYSLPNTIKSGYTSCYSLEQQYFTKGEHTITLSHCQGTFVLDSLVVSKSTDETTISALYDSDRSVDGVTSYLAIAPDDGYYSIVTEKDTKLTLSDSTLTTDATGAVTAYLKRGLNYIDVNSSDAQITVSKSQTEQSQSITLDVGDAKLSGSAKIKSDDDKEIEYIAGIDCNGGSAESNNEENGVHDYNVDLIEEYVTVSANGGKTQNVYCRNTYSWQTFKTVTFAVELKKGENVLTFTNNGEDKFNGNDTTSPHIGEITVNPIKL
jgi:hypothetical protein